LVGLGLATETLMLGATIKPDMIPSVGLIKKMAAVYLLEREAEKLAKKLPLEFLVLVSGPAKQPRGGLNSALKGVLKIEQAALG
jgi:hypothetical protein